MMNGKRYLAVAFLFMLAGCNFQKPDYVRTISAAELNQVMKSRDIFLVDVHTPEQRHIKGTDVFIPYDEVAKHQDQLPKEKNTPIYLYCEAGPMGNAAARSLHALGYSQIFNLEGGAKSWRENGLAFE